MKFVALFFFLLAVFAASAQKTVVPKEIKFERNVTQKITDKKSNTLNYYFTVSGEYAAMKPENEKTLIIYTKEGTMMIVSEKDKTIMVMDMKAFMTQATKKGEEIVKNQKDSSSSASKGSFKKTGNTKTICNYPADEYEVTTEKGKMNIWYIKTDFVSLPILAMGMGKMPGGKNTAGSNDFSDIPSFDKNSFMAEMEKDNKKVIETTSISKSDFTFSSVGYTVRDMSDMMKGNYGQ